MCDQAKIQSETIKPKLLLPRSDSETQEIEDEQPASGGATLQIVNILSNIAINTLTFPASFCIVLREIVAKLNHFSGKVCAELKRELMFVFI